MWIWWTLGAVILLIVVPAVILHFYGDPFAVEEEVEESEISDMYQTVGNLSRGRVDEHYFVIDPVNQARIWIHPEDLVYQDGDGKLWRLT